MGIEAMPIIGLGHRVPGPIAGLEILEDDAGFRIFLGGIAPDVEVALGAARRGAARALEPRMLIAGMVHHQFGDDADAAAMGLVEEGLEIVEGAVSGIDGGIIGDVVAVVAQGRRIEGEDPEGGYAQIGEIAQAAGEAGEIAEAVAVAILEAFHVGLIDDRFAVPKGFVAGFRVRIRHAASHRLPRPFLKIMIGPGGRE